MIELTTYDDVRDAFRSRELRQALYDAGERLMSGVIVNLHGEAHVARRRLENRLFRRDTFAWYERERIPQIINAVLAMPVGRGSGDLIPLARRTMMTLSIDVAGIDLVPTSTDSRAPDPAGFESFYGLMDRLARASTVAHAVGDPATIIADGDQALGEFDIRFFRPAVARRLRLIERVDCGELDAEALPRDVLTTLLRNQDRLDLAPEHVLREIAYFPWVGSHSTSGQLVHAMHHMFEWIAAHPASRAALTDDAALRQRFVHESMRLHPASPVAIRLAMADVELRSGKVLPEGETVSIGVQLANRDSAVFGADAARFNPYRSLPNGVAPWGFSFGHGMHACLGQELAGGLEAGETMEHHLLGAVTIMASAMFAAGARPDPSNPPSLDAGTTRVMWGRYPVLFDA